MKTFRPRTADPTKMLTRGEMATVLADLARKAARSRSTRMNLIIFRLACCCGLRASEIAHLKVTDVHVESPRPHIKVRASAAKGGYPRIVPLWWDAGTLEDLKNWKAGRSTIIKSTDAPLIVTSRPDREGTALSRHTLRKRFRTACKTLGVERLKNLTIHHGRHTFISHALAGGRTLAEVREAAGHSCVSITSSYLHVAVDDDGVTGSLFDSEHTQNHNLCIP